MSVFDHFRPCLPDLFRASLRQNWPHDTPQHAPQAGIIFPTHWSDPTIPDPMADPPGLGRPLGDPGNDPGPWETTLVDPGKEEVRVYGQPHQGGRAGH